MIHCFGSRREPQNASSRSVVESAHMTAPEKFPTSEEGAGTLPLGVMTI